MVKLGFSKFNSTLEGFVCDARNLVNIHLGRGMDKNRIIKIIRKVITKYCNVYGKFDLSHPKYICNTIKGIVSGIG